MNAYDGTPRLRGLEIVAGTYSNVRAETKFGHAPSLGTGEATIWSPLGIYVYPSGATAMTVSSGSTDDAAGGTGALTARVTGLDGDWVEVKQTVTLDGRTGVSIPTALRRIYRIEVLTAGSGGKNAGKIYVGEGAISTGIPAIIYAQIDVGENQTLMTPYTIEAGKVGYVTSIYASLGGSKDLHLKILIREPGEVFRVKRIEHVRSTPFPLQLDLPIGPIPAQSDIELRGSVDATTIDVSAAYDIVLIDA